MPAGAGGWSYFVSQFKGTVHHGGEVMDRNVRQLVIEPEAESRERGMLLVSSLCSFYSVYDSTHGMVLPTLVGYLHPS